jgi:hypothetical protein
MNALEILNKELERLHADYNKLENRFKSEEIMDEISKLNSQLLEEVKRDEKK